jgi:hypothetical protein
MPLLSLGLRNGFGSELLQLSEMSAGILSGITDIYVSIHTALPTGSAQNDQEIAYTSYARQQVARSSSTGWNFSLITSIGDNKNIIEFPQCTGVSDDVTGLYWGFGTASSGAGNMLAACPMIQTGHSWMYAEADPSADTLRITSGHLADQGLAEGQELAMQSMYGEGTMAGLLENVRYYIKTGSLSGSHPSPITCQLTTTAGGGGSAVNLVGNHAVQLLRVSPIRITNGVRPYIPASTLKWIFA